MRKYLPTFGYRLTVALIGCYNSNEERLFGIVNVDTEQDDYLEDAVRQAKKIMGLHEDNEFIIKTTDGIKQNPHGRDVTYLYGRDVALVLDTMEVNEILK